MKKILSIIIAVASLVSSTAMAAVTAPDGVTPADIAGTVGSEVTLMVGDPAIKVANFNGLNFDPVGLEEGEQLAQFVGSRTYVNAAKAGKYTVSYRWVDRFGDVRSGDIWVNEISQGLVTFDRPGWSTMAWSNEHTVILEEGVNSIHVEGGNFVYVINNQRAWSGIKVKLVNLAPVVTSVSGAEKPCKNETFTLSAVVDDNDISSVTYKIGDGAETAMTAGADNTYTANVALTEVGDNVITVTATDGDGQVATKTHTIECVEFKVSAPTITPITSGENTIYTGSLTINNQSSLPITTRIVVAVYDANNAMVGYKSEKYQIGVGTSPTVEASTMVPTAAGYRVEVIAWDSFVTMNELLVTPYGE